MNHEIRAILLAGITDRNREVRPYFDKLIGRLLDMYEYMDHADSERYISLLTDQAIADFNQAIPRDGLQDCRLKGHIEWYTRRKNPAHAYHEI